MECVGVAQALERVGFLRISHTEPGGKEFQKSIQKMAEKRTTEVCAA